MGSAEFYVAHASITRLYYITLSSVFLCVSDFRKLCLFSPCMLDSIPDLLQNDQGRLLSVRIQRVLVSPRRGESEKTLGGRTRVCSVVWSTVERRAIRQGCTLKGAFRTSWQTELHNEAIYREPICVIILQSLRCAIYYYFTILCLSKNFSVANLSYFLLSPYLQ